MKYKKIYEVLEQRRSSSPDFRYSDYSGWRSYYRSYMDRQRPLWIVAEDPSAVADDSGLLRSVLS